MYKLTQGYDNGDKYEPFSLIEKERYFLEKDNAVKALFEVLPNTIGHFAYDEEIDRFQRAVEKHLTEAEYKFKFIGYYIRLINNETEISVTVHEDPEFKNRNYKERAFVKVELIVPEDAEEREVI